MAKLTVFVFSSGNDCTNGGITSKHRMLELCTTKEEALELHENGEPALYLENRNLFGRIYKTAYPAIDKNKNSVGYMAGGNFVYTSDGRFKEYFGTDYPIPVHDRQETQREYNALSV